MHIRLIFMQYDAFRFEHATLVMHVNSFRYMEVFYCSIWLHVSSFSFVARSIRACMTL